MRLIPPCSVGGGDLPPGLLLRGGTPASRAGLVLDVITALDHSTLHTVYCINPHHARHFTTPHTTIPPLHTARKTPPKKLVNGQN